MIPCLHSSAPRLFYATYGSRLTLEGSLTPTLLTPSPPIVLVYPSPSTPFPQFTRHLSQLLISRVVSQIKSRMTVRSVFNEKGGRRIYRKGRRNKKRRDTIRHVITYIQIIHRKYFGQSKFNGTLNFNLNF